MGKHKVISPSVLIINGLDELVSPDTVNDYVAVYDADTGSNKKVAIDNLGAGGGTDTKQVKVSSNDTTEGYIESKIVAGSNVTITTLNDGANETLQISSTDTNTSALADLTDTTITTPTNGQVLTYNGSAWVNSSGGGGSGDVTGPSSSVDNAIARFDGTTGKIIQDYTSNAPTISDSGVPSFNNATYSQSEQVGASSVVSGARGSAFGNTALAGASSVALGCQSTSTGSNSIAIGYLATTSANNNAICIGRSSSAGASGLAVGRNSTCAGSNSLAVGYSASASGSNAVSIGFGTITDQQYSIAIGSDADIQTYQGINISAGGRLSKSNQAIIGGATLHISELVVGYGANNNSGSMADVNITTTSPITGTDLSGADLILLGSGRTGAGTGGDVKIQTVAAGTTGTTQSKTGADMFKATSSGEIVLNAEDAATADASLWANSLSFYLDETGNTVTVKAKYADGTTIKTGTIALT